MNKRRLLRKSFFVYISFVKKSNFIKQVRKGEEDHEKIDSSVDEYVDDFKPCRM